jgi:hypothetical protein
VPIVKVNRTAPTNLDATGELRDLANQYINGQGSKSLTVSAHDPASASGEPLSGIVRLAITDQGRGELAHADIACDPVDRCPGEASQTLTVDTDQLAEGAHDLQISVTDLAGNQATSESWTTYVDRTPPLPVTGASAEFDPEAGTVDVVWSDTADPSLPDGSPGSGLDHYTYRIQRDSAAWSDWASTDDNGFQLGGSHAGEQLHLQISGSDAVGNSASPWDGVVVAVDPDDDDAELGDDIRPGEVQVDSLGTSEGEYEGEDNDFPPGVVPEGAAQPSSFGVRVTESRSGAQLAAAPTPRCERETYDGDGPQDTFRIKVGRRGETTDGDPYCQFHIHYQVRIPFRDNVDWTWLAATRSFPDGVFDHSPYDDSRTRLVRDPKHWKPYYAHLRRLSVKPGSLITYWGRWHFKVPVPLPGRGSQIGGHYYGECIAWLNS